MPQCPHPRFGGPVGGQENPSPRPTSPRRAHPALQFHSRSSPPSLPEQSLRITADPAYRELVHAKHRPLPSVVPTIARCQSGRETPHRVKALPPGVKTNGRSRRLFSTHAGRAPYCRAEKPIWDKGGAPRTTALPSARQNDGLRNWRLPPHRAAPRLLPPLAGLEVPDDRAVLQTHKTHPDRHAK